MAKRSSTSESPTEGPPPGDPPPKQEDSKPQKETTEVHWIAAIHANDEKALKSAITKELNSIAAKHALNNYAPLILFDEVDAIMNFHADRLYSAASKLKNEKKDILLIIQSNGGRIEPAYLISKTLKKLSNRKFVVAIPRHAKSAATLLSLGADEIHMGLMSQMGPIDPQISGLPVLALGNALDVIAGLIARFPGTSEMFTKYLIDQIPIRVLGYYQRVGESAVQYAERLLANKKLPEAKKAEDIAQHLVTHYKDHDFVIDFDEAARYLGTDLVKLGTPEYAFADEIYQFLDFVGVVLDFNEKQFWFVGSLTDGIYVRNKPKSS